MSVDEAVEHLHIHYKLKMTCAPPPRKPHITMPPPQAIPQNCSQNNETVSESSCLQKHSSSVLSIIYTQGDQMNIATVFPSHP